MSGNGTSQGALEGLRVVEIAHERICFAGKLLADMGAEVIVVEPRVETGRAGTRPFSTTKRGRSAACTGGTTTRASSR